MSQNAVFMLVFDQVDTADRVLRAVVQLWQDKHIRLSDAAAIRKSESGRVSLVQTRDWSASEGAMGGGVVGLLIGTVLGGPIGGALFGIGLGALYAHLTDIGIDDRLMVDFGARMQPGCSALALLVALEETENLKARLSPYGGEWISVPLPDAAQAALTQALAEHPPEPEAEIKVDSR